MLAIVLIILGVTSRLIIHWPNFTPVIALALFSGIYLPRKYAFIIPVGFMMMADIIIGMHDTIFFTWGSMILITGIGFWIRKNRNFRVILAAGIWSAILFFIITNFGAWLSLYPKTWEGFKNCYWLAVPFFRPTLISTMAYTIFLFSLYEGIARFVKNTLYSGILLPDS